MEVNFLLTFQLQSGWSAGPLHCPHLPSATGCVIVPSILTIISSGGTLVLSSYLLASWEFTLRPATAPLANRAAPILLCHGTMDDKVDCSHITLPSPLFLAQVPVSCSQFCYDTLAPLVDSIKIRSAFMVCLCHFFTVSYFS